jgi:hypothetical protein
MKNHQFIEWVEIHKCSGSTEAYILKSFLESNGIRVILQGLTEDAIFPGLEFSKIPVLVPQADKEKAEKLLSEFLKDRSE